MRLGTSNGATGRQQSLGLMVETVVEYGRCGLTERKSCAQFQLTACGQSVDFEQSL